MAKRVLGNDPFLRGAAAREPRVPRAEGIEPVPANALRGSAAASSDREPARESGNTAADRPSELPPPSVIKPARERSSQPDPRSRSTASGDGSPGRPTERQARPSPLLSSPSVAGDPMRVPRAGTLPRSPFDRLPATVDPPPKSVDLDGIADAEIDGAGWPPHVPHDPAGDGLLPADLAATAPTPRVIAVPPLPERAPPKTNSAAIARAAPYGGTDAARGLVALLRGLALGDPRLPSREIDVFGRDPAFEAKVRPLLDWMYRRYFRVEEYGLGKLPRSGPLILVANRAGAIPWDAAMVDIAAAHHGREVRPLLEDAVFHFPFLGVLVNRLGAVHACPENAERLLRAGGAVTVFPEGASGFAKPFHDRYRLQRFGRGGFVRVALRTGATILPVAVVGSEETYPLLGRVPAKLLGFPFFPITPTWPWLGPAGLWPLPSKWSIELGDPVDLSGLRSDASDARVMRIADSVRTTIQTMLDARLAGRTAVFAD